MEISRFSHVKYSAEGGHRQNILRKKFKALEQEILADGPEDNSHILLEEFLLESTTYPENAYRSLIFTCVHEIRAYLVSGNKNAALIELEAAYYWAGKFIRLEEIEKAGA